MIVHWKAAIEFGLENDEEPWKSFTKLSLLTHAFHLEGGD
jgi:hypothetical protein